MGFIFDPLLFSGFVPSGSSVTTFKPPVANSGALPTVGNSDGDLRVTLDTDEVWVWSNGTSRWVNVGLRSAVAGSTPNASGYSLILDNGTANLSLRELELEPADATHPGILSTGAQTIGGAKTLNAALNLSGHLINNVTDPVSAQDAATKHYTDITFIPLTAEGVANGVATLDGSGKIPVAQLPSVVMEYQGAWNPNTNSPALSDGTGTNGFVYYVTALRAAAVAGLTDPSMVNFQIGDLVIYTTAVGKWQLVTPAAGVQSVNSAQGAVTVNAINQLTGDVTTAAASQSQSEAATVAKIQGTTVSGTTGSTNVVFSASPTLTGTLTAAAANFSGNVGINADITLAATVNSTATGTTADIASHPTETIILTNASLVSIGSINNQAISAGHLVTLVNKCNTDIGIFNSFGGGPGTSAPIIHSFGGVLNIPNNGTITCMYNTQGTNYWEVIGGTWTVALANTEMVSGILGLAQGGTSVTSVTTTPTATAFAGWDANKNLSDNNTLQGYTTTATGTGTTTLTVGSTFLQYFTGAGVQIVTLPVVSTLVLGQQFLIVNRSSGNVTVNSSDGSVVIVVVGSSQSLVTVILTSGTSAASWDSISTTSATFTTAERTADEIKNLSLTTSISANALTVRLLDGSGSFTPDASHVGLVAFTNPAGITSGNYKEVSITAATTITAPSGATFGLQNGVEGYIYVYLSQNGGIPAVCLSGSATFDEAQFYTTTAISSGSTSATTLYSTSTITNRPIRLMGRLRLTEATAGVYASGVTEIYCGYLSTYINKSYLTAKGGIISASSSMVPSVLSVGTDGQILSAASSQTTGLQWITPNIVTGDINQTSFVIANNTATADVTALLFANATVRSAIIQYSIFINATTPLYEIGEIRVIQKAASWDISVSSTGDNSNVVFSITNAGQVQYTSANYTGYVTGTMKFRALVTSV